MREDIGSAPIEEKIK